MRSETKIRAHDLEKVQARALQDKNKVPWSVETLYVVGRERLGETNGGQTKNFLELG